MLFVILQGMLAFSEYDCQGNFFVNNYFGINQSSEKTYNLFQILLNLMIKFK